MVKQLKMYLHGNIEFNYETGLFYGLSEKALELFTYTLHEVEFTGELDMDTGSYTITHVDGRELAK